MRISFGNENKEHRQRQKQIPFGNENCKEQRQKQKQKQKQKQIPFGNEKQRGHGKQGWVMGVTDLRWRMARRYADSAANW
jgi:hypothetical protein